MKIKSTQLLKELKANTENHIKRVSAFLEMSDTHLNHRHGPKSWTVLECIEHLNRYGDYYIPAIQESMEVSQEPVAEYFKSGMLGNYFAKTMLPKAKMTKMSTFKDKNPLGSALDKATIRRFNQQQLDMLDLLEFAATKDLNAIKIPITISRFIKFKLGDTFRFLIYHNERHIQQAERVVKGG
jgi:hypothetical protein